MKIEWYSTTTRYVFDWSERVRVGRVDSTEFAFAKHARVRWSRDADFFKTESSSLEASEWQIADIRSEGRCEEWRGVLEVHRRELFDYLSAWSAHQEELLGDVLEPGDGAPKQERERGAERVPLMTGV